MPIHGYPGGVITANPVAPTSTVATGVWTTEQQLQAKSAGNWPFTIPTQQISRSLRFNSADSAYLNRTPASAGNRTTWTFSFWVKRSALSSNQFLVSVLQAGAADDNIGFLSDDTFRFRVYDGGATIYGLTTTQLFRDVSAWYHIVCVYNSTSATSSNRMQLYVNGTQVTAFGTATYPTQNLQSTGINNTYAHNLGRYGSGSSYFNGYITEFNFIDGQALTPSSFGQTNASTGVWEPIAYTGTYGNNGFYLNFSDNSGTTSTTLGKDYSGNGNNWTPNNFSVTAGAGNDSMVDSPTSYGTDTGVGGEVRGNYATFNALTTTGNTLTNGNLDAAAAAAAWRGSFSTIGVSSGKWYMEFTIVGGTFARQIIGIALNSAVNSASFYGYGYVSGSQFMGRSVGAIPVDYSSGTLTSLSPTTDFDNGDVVGLCIDADAGKLWVFKNNTIIEGTVNGTANVTWTANSLVFPVASMYSGDSVYANFGQRAFAYTAPSGFKALCTQNLPTPTIGATSTTQANQYFDVELWTGNDTVRTITFGMQPDFIWTKGRNAAVGNRVSDSVRGASGGLMYNLVTNSTAAENTDTAITAIVSTGITLTSGNHPNNTGTTYVGWGWKGNGAGSTNTAGNITSTVSVSTASGFSIVTYTGNGSANQTVGHGLGVAPAFGILKDRDPNSNNDQWQVFHTAAGDKYGYLSTTAAFAGTAEYYPTTGSSTTVTVARTGGVIATTNENGDRFVMYLFAPVAGYSAFGSYTGNASADGPFVYTGFRPKFIMIKASSATGDWVMEDVARSPDNVSTNYLVANATTAEQTGQLIDFVSNGFKIRVAVSGAMNSSGVTYIYAAFAENPFKYSLAR